MFSFWWIFFCMNIHKITKIWSPWKTLPILSLILFVLYFARNTLFTALGKKKKSDLKHSGYQVVKGVRIWWKRCYNWNFPSLCNIPWIYFVPRALLSWAKQSLKSLYSGKKKIKAIALWRKHRCFLFSVNHLLMNAYGKGSRRVL